MACGNLFLQIGTVLLQCLGKVVLFEMFIFSFIIEKITTFCLVLSLYEKIDLFSLSIFTLFVFFCIPGTCVFYNSWKKFFFSIRDQIINFHAAF